MSDVVEAKCVGPGCAPRDQGEVVAVVATLDTIDRDKDIIPRGAFESGVRVKMSAYGHSSISDLMHGTGVPDQPPVGKGGLFAEDNKAVFRGKYFLTTEAGREAFHTAQEMGDEQEWSLGYRILETRRPSEALAAKGARRILARVQPLEVSPVLYAGGVGTTTVSTKCRGCGRAAGLACQCGSHGGLSPAEVVTRARQVLRRTAPPAPPTSLELARRVERLDAWVAQAITETSQVSAWTRETARRWCSAAEQLLGLPPATIRWAITSTKQLGSFHLDEPDVLYLSPTLRPSEIGPTVLHEQAHRFRARHGLPDPEAVVARDTALLLRRLS